MNLQDLKKPFPENDIEWRIGQSGKGGKGIWAKAFAYVTARAIQDRLDETVGPENWTCRYELLKDPQGNPIGALCTLAIKVKDSWIEKTDGAEATDMEPFKGAISAALKRAGSAWGIGRYLYNLDADFVEVSESQKPGFKFAQTKDKVPFYWKPKQLPDWALPAQPKFEGDDPSLPMEQRKELYNRLMAAKKPKGVL